MNQFKNIYCFVFALSIFKLKGYGQQTVITEVLANAHNSKIDESDANGATVQTSTSYAELIKK